MNMQKEMHTKTQAGIWGNWGNPWEGIFQDVPSSHKPNLFPEVCQPT